MTDTIQLTEKLLNVIEITRQNAPAYYRASWGEMLKLYTRDGKQVYDKISLYSDNDIGYLTGYHAGLVSTRDLVPASEAEWKEALSKLTDKVISEVTQFLLTT